MTYLFTKCVTKSYDSPVDWKNQLCYHSASSCVTESASIIWSSAECFQNCLNEETVIILSLNTVIPIIVMVWLSKVT